MTSQGFSIQQLLAKQLPNTDLSILSYLSSVLTEYISENVILCSNDLFNGMYESLYTYQIASTEEECKDMCHKLFQQLIKYKFIKNPDNVRLDILSKLKIGMKVMGQYTVDSQWYSCKINEVTDTKVHVTYSDYGNSEWLDPVSIKIPNIENPTGTKTGVKISDTQVVDDITNHIASLVYEKNKLAEYSDDEQHENAKPTIKKNEKKINVVLNNTKKIIEKRASREVKQEMRSLKMVKQQKKQYQELKKKFESYKNDYRVLEKELSYTQSSYNMLRKKLDQCVTREQKTKKENDNLKLYISELKHQLEKEQKRKDYFGGNDLNKASNEELKKLSDICHKTTARITEILKDRHENAVTCVICVTEKRRSMFQPCGHLCCCETCSSKVNKCPLCKAVIQQRFKCFL